MDTPYLLDGYDVLRLLRLVVALLYGYGGCKLICGFDDYSFGVSLSSLGTKAEYVGLSGVETEVVLPSVQRVSDENNERLKGLKKDYEEDVHRAVAIPVEHMSPQSYETSPRNIWYGGCWILLHGISPTPRRHNHTETRVVKGCAVSTSVRCRIVPPIRQTLSSIEIEELVAQHVSDAMTTYEANRRSGNGVHHEISASAGRVEPTPRGTDVIGHTKQFQELGLLCPGMVTPEEKKIERQIIKTREIKIIEEELVEERLCWAEEKNFRTLTSLRVKEKQEKDKIETKPNQIKKNGKRGKARQCRSPVTSPVIHQPPQEMSIQEMEDLKQQYLDEMKRLINSEYRDDKISMSSVENLIPIPSESEGIPENMCDVPCHDNSPSLDVSKDQFEDFSDSNDEFSSTDNESFPIDNIDYVEASLTVICAAACDTYSWMLS
nr:hypothetical protein [Tanacetum cinerariifolium]